MLKTNTVHCGNCSQVMAEKIPDESIDLVVTSPPYDNLRDYNGYEFDFEEIAQQLWRVIKPGGVVVWVVGDATIDGSETGTSFRQALRFKEIGFKLHDTMIYKKNSSSYPSGVTDSIYTQIFEYMFVFGKGKVSGNLIADKLNKWAGHKDFSGKNKNPTPKCSPRTNIWKYTTSFNGVGVAHPAPFPEALARDHILSWSNAGDIVLDPMCGSGTTLKMAKESDRKWIGIDVSQEYCDLSLKRVKGAKVPLPGLF